MPLLRIAVEDFIKKEGKLPYLWFGEWIEGVRLAGATKDLNALKNILVSGNMADVLLKQIGNDKNVPKGVVDSLKKLSQYKNKKELTKLDAKKALKIVDNIIAFFG